MSLWYFAKFNWFHLLGDVFQYVLDSIAVAPSWRYSRHKSLKKRHLVFTSHHDTPKRPSFQPRPTQSYCTYLHFRFVMTLQLWTFGPWIREFIEGNHISLVQMLSGPWITHTSLVLKGICQDTTFLWQSMMASGRTGKISLNTVTEQGWAVSNSTA